MFLKIFKAIARTVFAVTVALLALVGFASLVKVEYKREVTPLPLHEAKVSAWDNGDVWAEGAWAVRTDNHEDQLAFVNSSKIRCYRDISVCYEAIATEMFAKGFPYLDVDLNRRTVKSWDEYAITWEEDSACRKTEVKILLKLRKVEAISTNKVGGECPAEFTILRPPTTLVYVDGETSAKMIKN